MWPNGNRTSNFPLGFLKMLAESRSPGAGIARRYYAKQNQKARESRESRESKAGDWR
jgi:hypothetical protein